MTFTLDKNTYRPGETATLHYKITSIDGTELPEQFTLTYGFQGATQSQVETSEAEGNLKVTVPSYASDGEGYFYIGGTTQRANVRASPNPLAETVGDMSVLEIILLLVTSRIENLGFQNVSLSAQNVDISVPRVQIEV